MTRKPPNPKPWYCIACGDAGVALSTLKRQFSEMYATCGVINAAQMAYLIAKGWA